MGILKDNLNMMKDIIVDIQTRLDVYQFPIIVHIVDQHTLKLGNLEKE